MKTKIILSIFLFMVILMNAQNQYYYYKGEKIILKVDRNNFNIVTNDGVLDFSIPDLTVQDINLKATDKEVQKIKKLTFKSLPDETEYKNTVKKLKQNKNIKYILPYFERKGGTPIGTSNVFYVKLKNESDSTLLKRISAQKNVSVIKQIPCMPLWYMLSLNSLCEFNSLEASNFFYETGYFQDVDPAFMFEFRPTCTNDPLFNQLWGLYNSSNPEFDINICEAWNFTRGGSIKVAVVDQGIDINHNDLSANIHPLSFDAQSGTSPSVFSQNRKHGTHVAGTVAAVRDNNLQVVGVAPEAKLMGVSHPLYVTTTISAELASGISWAWQNGADVITNSWGDQGGVLYDGLHSVILENAIVDAMTRGRQGKGSLVVFAAGNYGDYSPIMDYPATFHNDIITVGAIVSNGTRAEYSGYGNKLDVVAPGSNILSTIPNNDTDSYYGTSMAAPHVAGLSALILSINPNLTRYQVTNIIESSCQKIGGYTYNITSGKLNGTWNNEMGYGLIDAYKALQLAQATLNNPVIIGKETLWGGCTEQYLIPGSNPIWSCSGVSGVTIDSNTGILQVPNDSTLNGIITVTANHYGQIYTKQVQIIAKYPVCRVCYLDTWGGEFQMTRTRLPLYFPVAVMPGNIMKLYLDYPAYINGIATQYDWNLISGFMSLNSYSWNPAQSCMTINFKSGSFIEAVFRLQIKTGIGTINPIVNIGGNYHWMNFAMLDNNTILISEQESENPDNSFVMANQKSVGYRYEIQSIYGFSQSLIENFNMEVGRQKRIDISTLSPGLYVLNIYKNGQKVFSKKFRKN